MIRENDPLVDTILLSLEGKFCRSSSQLHVQFLEIHPELKRRHARKWGPPEARRTRNGRRVHLVLHDFANAGMFWRLTRVSVWYSCL